MDENELREYIRQKDEEMNQFLSWTSTILLLIGPVLFFSILPAALHYTPPLPLQLLGGFILGMAAAVAIPAFAPFYLLAMFAAVGAGAAVAGLGFLGLGGLFFFLVGRNIWPGD